MPRLVRLHDNVQTDFTWASATSTQRWNAFHFGAKSTRYLLGSVVLALTCTPAAAADFGICCMKAAREQFNVVIFDAPWSACGVEPAFDFTKDTPLNSVNASLGWCKEHCGGYQASVTSQWLLPLATWVIPPFTLLILCSIGEPGNRWPFRPHCSIGEPKKDWPFKPLCYWVTEYLAILGDPASAICGGFSELWVNARLAEMLSKTPKRENKKEPGGVPNDTIVGFAMVAGQTELSGLRLEISPRPDDSPNEKTGTYASDVPVIKGDLDDDACKALERGIRTVLRARIDFVNGVTLPVVLALATTASVFYTAYQTIGDSDTAFGLAFGIWYSWVIVLAVVSNSSVASANPGVAAAAVGDSLPLSPRTVPLRDRMRNTKEWRYWALKSLGEKPPSSFFWPYLCGQAISWIIVAFFCACAATISYNTPTIGIGCRSFSFMLYGSLAAIVALLMMLRDWAVQRYGPKAQRVRFLKSIYIFLVALNAFVLVFSTIAQLVGLYRSCFCQHFGPLSSVLELSTGNAQSIDNARKTWIPVGFVAYTGVWLVCGVAIGLRAYVASHIKEFLGD
jgi:hypothetical protein